MSTATVSLTRNPQTGTYGFTCTEHGILRTGLTQQHAINAEAKHLRDHHDPMAHLVGHLTLDLTAAAVYAAAAYTTADAIGGPPSHAADLWEALVGLPTDEARSLAVWLLSADHVTAAVIP